MARKKKNENASISDILNQYPDVLMYGNDDRLSYDRIPFNISSLDSLIGGGIPKKRITLLGGQSNAGKSYLASQAVVSVQQMGGQACWIDNEISWDSSWMEKCGVNTSGVYVAQPTTGENCFDMIEDVMKSGDIDLIVLDSIAGLVPSNLMEENFDYSPIAWQARFINQSIPRIMPHLKHGCAVILINQIRESIGNVSIIDQFPGGKAQTFFSHCVLQIRRSGWITDTSSSVRVGFDMEVRNIKTKSGGYSQKSCIIPFRFDGGLDIMESEIREAIRFGMIKQSGAWYQLPNGDRKIGTNNVKQYYIENPNEFKELLNNINSINLGGASDLDLLEDYDEEIN